MHHAFIAGWRARAVALAVALAGLTSACGDVGGAADPRPGDLFIADMDAGPVQPDGERLGMIFRARPDDDAGTDGDAYELSVFAEDSRWREPVDVLVLPDHCVLILDQQYQPDDGPARGAIFRTYWAGGPVTLVWSDPRARQLVAMAWSRRERMLYVTDRDADPLGLGQNTGCVFAIPLASDDTAGEATIAAAGPELVTPGAVAVLADNRVLVMDADSNPYRKLLPDGRAATPGVLFELRDGRLVELLAPDVTVSPIALIERDLRDPDDPEVRREERDRRRAELRRERRSIRLGSRAPDSREPRAEEDGGDESRDEPGDEPGDGSVTATDDTTDADVELLPPPPPPPFPPTNDAADDEDEPDADADAEAESDIDVDVDADADGEADVDDDAEVDAKADAHAARDPRLALFLVDANEGMEPGVMGDGALFRVEFSANGASLLRLIDSLSLGRPRAMVDPAGGDVLADGRLVLADANADPLGLGEDGTKKGVYGTGRGAILVLDPDAGSVETLLASERFVTPVAVRRVR